MKKIGVFLLVSFLLISLFGGVCADLSGVEESLRSVDSKVADTAEKIEKTKDTLSNKEIRNEYLRTEFVKILETKKGFKEIIENYRKVSPYSNPILEYIVGVVPSLTLFFILVLVIWFLLVKYSFATYGILTELSTFSKGTSLVLSLALFVILTVLQVFQKGSIFLANEISSIIAILESPIVQVVGFILFVAATLFLSKFSKQIKIVVKQLKGKFQAKGELSKQKELMDRQESATKIVEDVADAAIGNSSSEKGFNYSKGMRRGGEKSTRSRFVSKAAVERYSGIFGDDAAKERFG